MKSLMTKYKVLNPKTGEIKDQLRRVPRVFADISYEPGDNPVQQQFKHECDINYIVKNYQIPQQNLKPENFGDFTSPHSFQESMNIVANAQQQFLQLPATVRARFENDPHKMLQFIADPENASELIKMGLATKTPATPEPAPVKVILDKPWESEDPKPRKKPEPS